MLNEKKVLIQKTISPKDIAKKCLKCKTNPSCMSGCSLHNQIPFILNDIMNDNFDNAIEKLFANNPFPYLTPVLCDKNMCCYAHCIKKEKVPFYQLEEYLGIKYFNELITYKENIEKVKVAIIGGGICGLSIAHTLLKQGLSPTIYEKEEKLGGIVQNEIPTFRLNQPLFDEHINKIISLCEIVKKEVGKDISINELKQKYQYLIFTTGNQINRKVFKENTQNPNDLLKRIKKGEIVYTNKRIIVIGGGNTACDISRALKRLNNDVTICYRRNMDNSPAAKEEINNTINDGVIIKECVSPVEIIKNNKDELILKFEKNRLVSVSNDTRQKFEGTGEYLNLVCDVIVEATGSMSDYSLISSLNSDTYSTEDLLNSVRNNYSGQLFIRNADILVGGDYCTGPKTVASAIASGVAIGKELLLDTKETYLFGGSFNPVTIAHEAIINSISENNRLIIVPNGNAYHNKKLIDYQYRKEMLELICKNKDHVIISDIEAVRDFKGSIETLRALNHPTMIIGDDCLEQIKNWIKASTLVEENSFLVLTRNHSLEEVKKIIEQDEFLKSYKTHFKVKEFTYPEVSSSKVRKNNDFDNVSTIIKEYIKRNKLYGE